MNNLIPIEHKNQRVLTTAQLAEYYETDIRRISENFQRNSERYIQGVHYFILEGEEKRIFCDYTQIADGSKNAQWIYLWTEKAALLHAKSLNTDKAWEVYQVLVDTYFRVREIQSPPLIDSKFLYQLAAQLEEKEKKNQLLSTENKLLSKQSLTWANRKILEAIVKAYGSFIDQNKENNQVNGFQEAWREFKKELLYAHGINLNSRITNHLNSTKRKTKPKTTDMIHDEELPACVSTAVALCTSHNVDISDIISKYQVPA